jgi:hypothetical protein
MYIQHLDLSKERDGLLEVKPAYYNRDPLLQKYIKVSNKNYLGDSYYLYTYGSIYKNSSIDDEILVNLKRWTSRVGVGLQTQINDKLTLRVDTAYHHSYENYFEFDMHAEYQTRDRVKLLLRAGHNVDTAESTQLYIAGKKDTIIPRVQYNILKSTLIDMLYENNRYFSEDGAYLGRGEYGRVSVARLIKNGYPDLHLGVFYDRGLYVEDQGSNGVIDTIQTLDFEVLPRDFYNYGLNFAYGMANSDIYTRVWRGYADISAYYNSDIDDYTYGFNVGYGGKVWHQDHLVFGANYTQSVNGVGGSIFELFLDYKFLYFMPR